MKLIGKIVIVLFILGALSVLFFTWYVSKHSMDEAKPFDINTPEQQVHILIATQGSAFKDAVVQEVIRQLLPYSYYIKVIDVSVLKTVNESDWAAIVILHTWEYSKPPKEVSSFVDRLNSTGKLVMVSTSGQGTYLLEHVDGITAASKLEEVTAKATEVTMRVKAIVNRGIENINPVSINN
jgi:hypothetical protein